jgi:microcystin-dependent protein
MSTAFVGEVRLIGFAYAPVGWNFCDGTLISISENPTLFNLIGTTYGGDGQTNYALPDLRGRVPIHQGTLQGGSNYVIGQPAGVESVTLTINQIPSHNHLFQCNSNSSGDSADPTNRTAAAGPTIYRTTTSPTDPMNSGMLKLAGGSQPHENRQPFQAMNWVIALYGVYPTQS